MKRAKAEAARWLAQAESDLGFAELGLREGFFAQACFVCQQAAEKALKGAPLSGRRPGRPRALRRRASRSLGRRHPGLGDLREGAQQLDQYYIPTRYPNGLPGGVPAEVFTRRQAEEAVGLARRFLAQARAAVG